MPLERAGIIMKFENLYNEYQEIINKELKEYIRKDNSLENNLNNAMEYSLISGGKRIRPILVVATYKMFRDDYEECLPFAIALEMVHNFSLVHDDLPEVDNDDLRHGKPTTHKKFGHVTALFAGDELLNEAYKVLSNELFYSFDNQYKNITKNKIRAFQEFTNGVDRMLVGEFLDTQLEGHKINNEILEYIHKNKTGELLKLSVRMGSIISGASEKDIEKLSNYAEKIGLAFQIKDDILSEEGKPEITGKPVGNDKEMDKCTYVSYYGLEGAKEKLEEITEEAIKELKEYGEKSIFLKELALYIKNRNK